MDYPKSVITKNKQGKEEVRLFLERGSYVRYGYINPKTGKIVKKGKESIILKNKDGKLEHLYIIPLKKGKGLMLKTKANNKIKLWDKKNKKKIKLF